MLDDAVADFSRMIRDAHCDRKKVAHALHQFARRIDWYRMGWPDRYDPKALRRLAQTVATCQRRPNRYSLNEIDRAASAATRVHFTPDHGGGNLSATLSISERLAPPPSPCTRDRAQAFLVHHEQGQHPTARPTWPWFVQPKETVDPATRRLEQKLIAKLRGSLGKAKEAA